MNFFHFSGYGKLKNLNDPAVLSKMNLKEADIWTPSIQGFLGEPARCFTYQPPAQRGVGFANAVSKTFFLNLNL